MVDTKNILAIVGVIAVLIISFLVVGGLTGEINTSSGQIHNTTVNATNLPLSSLFSSSGVVWIVVMSALLIGLIGLSLKTLAKG